MAQGAPQQSGKKAGGSGSKMVAIVLVVLIIVALAIVVISYMATRPGGFSGRGSLSDTMMERARRSGAESPGEMFEQSMGGEEAGDEAAEDGGGAE